MNILEKFQFCPVCGSKHFSVNGPKSLRCDNCHFEYFLNASAAVVGFILNERHEILVERRKFEPGKGMLDLPGGFVDVGETAEQAIAREIREETAMELSSMRYLFSYPNKYRYGGLDIPTMDLFFLCEVKDTSTLHASDAAAECMWIATDDIHTEQFGLRSVRQGLYDFINMSAALFG